MQTRESGSSMKRRAFLTMTGAVAGAATVGGIPGILRAQKPPSFPKGTKLHLLEWVSFVPAADVELKRLGAEFGKQAGVDVTVELHQLQRPEPAHRIGHRDQGRARHHPDAQQLGRTSTPTASTTWTSWPSRSTSGTGACTTCSGAATFVSGRWKAVPMGTSPATFAYRTDWFKEAGAAKFPDTMDEFRKVGTELKKKDRPIGQAFGHSLGRPERLGVRGDLVLRRPGGRQGPEDGS